MTLRDLRKQAKMTAKEVAEKLNITERAVYSYEQRTRGCDIFTAYNLSKLYGVTLDEIVECLIFGQA